MSNMEKIEINGHLIDPQYYIKKWTDWALNNTPATDEEVINNVQTLYTKAGLDKPEVKVFRDYDKFISQDWDSVRDSVGTSVWASVEASVWAWYFAEYLGFADVLSDTKVLHNEKTKELKEYKRLLETQRLGILTKEVAYILVAPIIRRNEQGLLHSDELLAVDWNGTGLYYLNGVKFPKELWEKVVSRKMPFEEILAIKDIDQRTQAMRYGDVRAFLKHTKAELLDKSAKNELFKIPKGDIFQKDAYFLVYSCPSTAKVYMSGVTKEVGESKSADYAMAWKSGISIEDFINSIPLVHES